MTLPFPIQFPKKYAILRSIPFLVLERARPPMLSYSYTNSRPVK